MKTCITFHPHEIALCPGPMTLLRPIHSSCLEIPSCCPYGQPGDVLAVRETWRVRLISGDKCRVQFKDLTFGDWRTVELQWMHNRWWKDALIGSNLDWRSPATMPAVLARWQFRVAGVEVKQAFEFSDSELVRSGLYDTNRHYPRVRGPVNPLLWVMRGNVEARP